MVPAYLDFLQNVSNELWEDVPLATRRDMWYLHDSAPPHCARDVTQWLNNNFGEKWIARYGPVLRPARLPDLNPCDLFLWGHMKQLLVYATPVNTIEDLTARVTQVTKNIPANPLIRVRTRESMARRAQSCIDNAGRHFENLL
jgi:uncharacterized protein involved in tellurium resistance